MVAVPAGLGYFRGRELPSLVTQKLSLPNQALTGPRWCHLPVMGLESVPVPQSPLLLVTPV